MTKEERLKEPRKFYEIYIHKETNHVVLNCGNILDEDAADGNAVDFIFDDSENYKAPDDRFAMWMSIDMAESLIGHLQLAIQKLEESKKDES